ncbi:hypothetical protein I4U23_026731 [Adineta vaga]|nr:hypothetical protein I4U23_026731 [Adineta vaga]
MKFSQVILLIFFVITDNIHQTSSIALGIADTISLYNATDKLSVLTSQNFSSTVYQSKTAWLIEFYASWCGHCRSYANIYREIAANAWTWKSIVRVGAINCYGGDSLELCRQRGVRGFPTIQLIRPGAAFDNTSKPILIPATDAEDVTKELIRELDNIHRKYNSWPDFTPANRVIFEELYARVPRTTKLLLVIVEKRDDLIGRQLILDFSKYQEQMTIFRTTLDGRLWHKFHINITDVPALFVILKNRTAERIPVKHNRRNTSRRKVNMVDLELVLSHMFRQEIPQMKDIQGQAYHALIQWLTVLIKYFPGREPIMNYLERLLSKVKEQSNGFSGNAFQQLIDTKTSDAYLPNNHNRYQYCAGSQPQYRGYPCALWLLFHTLTVSQYEKESQQLDVLEVPLAIKSYVKHFFTCRQCSQNFMNETMNITQINTKNKQEAILYLWKVHNHVNKRLRADVTEDPRYPKVQFPTKFLCPTSKNIDSSLILKESQQRNEFSSQSEYLISKLDSVNETNNRFDGIRYLPNMIQKYPFYTFILFILLIIAISRHRHCQAKRKRYTL